LLAVLADLAEAVDLGAVDADVNWKPDLTKETVRKPTMLNAVLIQVVKNVEAQLSSANETGREMLPTIAAKFGCMRDSASSSPVLTNALVIAEGVIAFASIAGSRHRKSMRAALCVGFNRRTPARSGNCNSNRDYTISTEETRT